MDRCLISETEVMKVYTTYDDNGNLILECLLGDALLEWLDTNAPGRWSSRPERMKVDGSEGYSLKYSIEFEDPVEMVFFKLRWGEYFDEA